MVQYIAIVDHYRYRDISQDSTTMAIVGSFVAGFEVIPYTWH